MRSNKIIKISPLGFQWKTQDPFIFCVHHRDEFPKGNDNMGPAASLAGRNIGQDFTVKDGWRMYHGTTIPGFPYHPHRGFETVTIVKEGFIDHTDSLGAAARFGSGDVQWLTAGKGIQHSEMFPLLYKDKENPLELFQIWLNLPRKGKFVEPYFKMFWQDQIPVINEKDNQGKSIQVEVIAGTINNIKALDPPPDSWAADPENQLMILTIKLQAGASWILPKTSPDANRALYFYKGSNLQIEDTKIPAYHSIDLQPDQDVSVQAGDDDCFLLMLQGKPINEPVVQHGPFVMTTQEEIRQTFEDYQRTQFGGWPWPEHEQAHDRNRGRFAIHADGREETRALNSM